MAVAIHIRRGRGPVWASLKRLARAVLHLHVPVGPRSRPLFRLLYALHVAAREGLAWGLRFLWYEPLFRGQCLSVGAGFQMEQLPYLTGQGRIILGRGVRLSGKPSIGFSNCLGDTPELVVGDGTFIGHDCSFNVATSVRIGRYCLLAGGVKVYDVDAHPSDATLRRTRRPFPPENSRPVVIGDDVWIGARATILKGVTIGERSIVGSGAVVAADVPPDVVVAGNPARVIKRLGTSPGA